MLDIADLERRAQARLDPAFYDYIAGGAGRETTLSNNERGYSALALRPRVMAGCGQPVLKGQTCGQVASMPVLIAPTAFHRLAHADGESGTARAAAVAGIPMILSMAATEAIEDVAAAAGVCPWFQLYLQSDMAFNERLVRRAERAGCPVLVVTVDSPAFGRRMRDVRHGFTDLPAGYACENMRDGPGSIPRPIDFSPSLSWREIAWLRVLTQLPILLKGIMHPDDARIALDHGVDGIYVSNHGGRQLDDVAATIDLLPDIARVVARRVPIILDGGIRHATDIVKAIALGATAIGLGRPVVWALATEGETGVIALLDTIREDLAHTLALCGCGSPVDLEPSLVVRSPHV